MAKTRQLSYRNKYRNNKRTTYQIIESLEKQTKNISQIFFLNYPKETFDDKTIQLNIIQLQNDSVFRTKNILFSPEPNIEIEINKLYIVILFYVFQHVSNDLLTSKKRDKLQILTSHLVEVTLSCSYRPVPSLSLE